MAKNDFFTVKKQGFEINKNFEIKKQGLKKKNKMVFLVLKKKISMLSALRKKNSLSAIITRTLILGTLTRSLKIETTEKFTIKQLNKILFKKEGSLN